MRSDFQKTFCALMLMNDSFIIYWHFFGVLTCTKRCHGNYASHVLYPNCILKERTPQQTRRKRHESSSARNICIWLPFYANSRILHWNDAYQNNLKNPMIICWLLDDLSTYGIYKLTQVKASYRSLTWAGPLPDLATEATARNKKE